MKIVSKNDNNHDPNKNKSTAQKIKQLLNSWVAKLLFGIMIVIVVFIFMLRLIFSNMDPS